MNRSPAPLLAITPFVPSSLRPRQEFLELSPPQKDKGGLLLKQETFTAAEDCFEHTRRCLRTLIALRFFMRTTPHIVAP